MSTKTSTARWLKAGALTGVKTYDGYYLSFAEGYLCDEINHYETLTYGSESQYVTRETTAPRMRC